VIALAPLAVAVCVRIYRHQSLDQEDVGVTRR
jgi:hypothetical protein